MSSEPTERFSGRVQDYVRYRPGYPDAVVDVLGEEAGLSPGWVVADVGSGTGLSARPLLDHGNVVHGVEPNADMRRAAETLLAEEPGFRSVAGRAEATTLPAGSVDLVLVAQAFHWLDPAAARAEFLRILRPGGCVALMWNTRRTAATPFLRGYERLLERHGTDYARVRHDRDVRSRVSGFFGGAHTERRLYNEQLLDLDGLRGRILSSSYTPAEGDAGRADLERDIRRLFHSHADEGLVRIQYDLEIYVGRLDG